MENLELSFTFLKIFFQNQVSKCLDVAQWYHIFSLSEGLSLHYSNEKILIGLYNKNQKETYNKETTSSYLVHKDHYHIKEPQANYFL